MAPKYPNTGKASAKASGTKMSIIARRDTCDERSPAGFSALLVVAILLPRIKNGFSIVNDRTQSFLLLQ